MHRTHPRTSRTRRTRSVRQLTLIAGGFLTALVVAAVPAQATSGKSTHVHPTPRVPFVLDGARYAGRDIHRFDGIALHFRASKGRDGRLELIASRIRPKRPQLSARTSSEGGSVRFFEHANGQGASHTVWAGESIADLRKISMCWFCASYNDRISSVELNGGSTTIFDDPYFRGDSLELPGAGSEWGRYELWLMGWNDRASSLYVS